jgi:PEP-CTERM motif
MVAIMKKNLTGCLMRHTSTLLGSIFLVASLAATSAHAANSVSIASSTCTGTEVRSLTGDAIFTCSGDYSFLSGSIKWDTNISITANGSLYFDDFTIKGNHVELIALNGLSFSARTLIQVPITTMNSGNLGTRPGPYFISIPADRVPIGVRGVDSVVATAGNIGIRTDDVLIGDMRVRSVVPESGNISSRADDVLIGDMRVRSVVPESGNIILRASRDLIVNTGVISVSPGPGAILVSTGGELFRDVLVVSAVPEPEAYAMLLAGLGLVGVFMRRRKLNLTA